MLSEIVNHATEVLKQIIQTYHTRWNDSFVTIKPADYTTNTQSYTARGDANIFESILACAEYTKFEESIILLQTPQPSFGGKIITYNPTSGNKNQYCIVTTNGCFISGTEEQATKLIWDIRTQQLVEIHAPQNAQAGLRQMEQITLKQTHADEQTPPRQLLVQLCNDTIHASQKTFAPLEIEWEIVQGKLVYTQLRRIEYFSEAVLFGAQLGQTAQTANFGNLDQTTVKQHTLIARGTKICGGIIAGKPFLAGRNGTKEFGDVLIADTLQSKDLPLLKQASGIICHTHIKDGAVIHFIKKHTIPCIASVSPKITQHNLPKHLILNASQGTVLQYLQQTRIMSPIQAGTATLTQTPAQHSFTKVFRWQKNPYYQPTQSWMYPSLVSHTADGSVFTNDFLMQIHGVHPLHELKRDSKAFSLKLADAILFTSQNEGLVAYQTCDLHDGQLNILQFAPQHGPLAQIDQENPAFGVRGGLQILHDSTLFEAELSALARVAKATRKDIPCIVPFVRTVSELVLVLDILERINQLNTTNIQLYLRIDLPSQIHQLQHLMRPGVKGIVVNIPKLHAIAYGIDDTNTFLTNQYPLDRTLAKQYLAQVVTQCTRQIPIWVITHTMSDELIKLAQEWGISALITKATQVAACKIALQDTRNRVY